MTEKKISEEKPESVKIWEEISSKPLDLFGLPGQTVAMHVVNLNVPHPQYLLVKLRSGATLPALEATLKGQFEVELLEGYVKVSRAEPSPVAKK